MKDLVDYSPSFRAVFVKEQFLEKCFLFVSLIDFFILIFAYKNIMLIIKRAERVRRFFPF